MSPEDRARRAKELLEDQVLNDALAEIERVATWQMAADYRWWWGVRRIRLAAEHLKAIKNFRDRLQETLVRFNKDPIDMRLEKQKRYVP